MIDDDDDEFDDDDEDELDSSAGSDLGGWIEEHYVGDARFEIVELAEPGPLEGEDLRVSLIVNEDSEFFVCVLSDDGVARVGLSTKDRETSERIEHGITESGESMTEFLEDVMDTDEELEHEMRHFHDDAYYFCSDIPFADDDQLASRAFRDEVVSYLEGYIEALGEFLEGETV